MKFSTVIKMAGLFAVAVMLNGCGWVIGENIAFGQGGALLQQINRDTLKFAMKASAAKVNGVWRDVYKDPVTDKGKRSKKGLLGLVTVDGEYNTVSQAEAGDNDLLKLRFRNGELFNQTTFAEVRERANKPFTA